MKVNRWLAVGVVGVAVAAASVWAAIITTKTFRTTAVFRGVMQKPGTSLPEFQNITFIGSNVVNLAMGRTTNDTSAPDQVLAMTFSCDMDSASLVVYDRSTSNVVATIATSASMDTVEGIGLSTTGKTNDVKRFVTQLEVQDNGNAANGLVGGFLTVAGRVHINPATGCPEAVLVKLDKDPQDKNFGDRDISSKLDADPQATIMEAGLAHLIGVLDVVSGGSTNTVLVPFGELTIRGSRPVIAVP